MSAGEAERIFRNATNWHDADVAVGFKRAEIEKAVDEDGEVDLDKVYKAASDLVEAKPYLKAAKDSPRSDLPNGPTGTPVGSGRRFYGRPVADAATLRAKYRMDS